MSTASRPDTGTAVAVRDERDGLAIGELPPDVQRALTFRKMQNRVAAQLAGMSWGKGLDLDTRRATADWGQQHGVDVTTEIHILGNNIYLNAAFWLRKLSEMVAAGLVEYAVADHVEHDARLTKMGADGEGESNRRLRERIRHGIPDEAKSAVVFRVKLRSMDREVTGVKYCGGGTRKNDPVGEAFPLETSESRAARRAMRLLASHVPPAKAEEIDRIEASADLLSARVEHARNEVRAQNDAIAARHPKNLIAGPIEPGSYDFETRGTAQPREVEARRAEVAPVAPDLAQLAATPDPYDSTDNRTSGAKGRGSAGGGEVGAQRSGGPGASSSSADSSTASGLATREQKERIAELLSTDGLDLAEAEIQRIAKIAGAPSYPARDAVREIARLEKLIPGGDDTLFGTED